MTDEPARQIQTDYYGCLIDDYPIPPELAARPGIPLGESMIGEVVPYEFSEPALHG